MFCPCIYRHMDLFIELRVGDSVREYTILNFKAV